MKSWVVMADAGYASDADATVYTVPAGQTAIIDKCVSYSAAGGTLTLRIVPSGGTLGVSNVMYTKVHAAGESYTWPEMVGQQMKAGDFITEAAAAASTVVRRISGRAGS